LPVEVKFSGDEIGGARLGTTLGLESREGIGIDFAFLNDPADEVAFMGQAVGQDDG